ncbi:MAG: DUF839 domain-containing protein [Gammaproteobacteria bacterium]|nr:DUF839 domain-containing protein [Gammaproteobacteria bacterium]
MLSRRRFLRGVGAVTTAAFLPLGVQLARAARAQAVLGYGELTSDPEGLFDLPPGFSYRIISRTGERMADGLRVPELPDGMHAFAGPEGKTVLLRNHELYPWSPRTAFQHQGNQPTAAQRALLYDPGPVLLVGRGGVTTLLYDTRSRRLERQFLSLGGTLRNCSGGATPWGSWISCEETVTRSGQHGATRDHGFNFEVSADARGLAKAVPLTAMGRFYHEAVAVDPVSGIAYQTEDLMDGLLYRFVPDSPARYARGGRLEALRIPDLPGVFTGNHDAVVIPAGESFAADWVPLENVTSPDDDLRHQGRTAGAAVFARGEGMTVERDTQSGATTIWFVCTAGGRNARGQLWRYQPGAGEGTARETPGRIELFLEPNDGALLNHGDNVTVAPNGDLAVCEDNSSRQRLIGITAEGGVYRLAANARGGSELAGATFSPDASTLFVNLQQLGLTLAVTGPWERRRAG